MYYFPCKDLSICDEVMKRNLLKFNVKREIYEGNLAEIRRILEVSLNPINDGEVYCFEPEFKEKDVSECIFCKKIFCSKGNLYNHVKKCTNNDNMISKDLQCTYCKKEFTLASSLNRHLKDRCKVKKQQDNAKEDLLQKLVDEMKKQSDEMKKQNEKMTGMQEEISRLKSENKKYVQKIGAQHNNSTNIDQQNIQINNNHLNIKLLAFGKEDMSHLVDEVYKKVLNKGFKSVPTLVNFVHFNRNRPQNHNVYISNIQTNYALVYDGDDWKLKERDDVLRQLIDDKKAILSDKFDELLASLDEPTVRKFRRFLDESDQLEVICQIKNDLKLLLYNNKKIPEKTRQLLCPPEEANKLLKID
jgi:hypothetical protein